MMKSTKKLILSVLFLSARVIILFLTVHSDIFLKIEQYEVEKCIISNRFQLSSILSNITFNCLI